MRHSRIKNNLLYIDYLKAAGLILIILAHTCQNEIIINLRVFDVPLMVVLSGFLAYDSYLRSMTKNNKLWDYYKKRIFRLLFPTWIFLTCYFLLVRLFNINNSYPYTIETIARSYLLLDGIGYVWIIRVYLICALLTPFVVKLCQRIKVHHLFLLLSILFIIHELLVYYEFNKLNFILEYILAYIIPYGCIYILGLISRKTKSKYYDFLVSGFFLLTFIIIFLINLLGSNKIIALQSMKYPPTIYFTSYSLAISFLLLGLSKRIRFKDKKTIDFLSHSSLWIYLWHILIIYILNDLNIGFWPLNFLLVIVGASSLTLIQNLIIDHLEKNRKINKNLLVLFRG